MKTRHFLGTWILLVGAATVVGACASDGAEGGSGAGAGGAPGGSGANDADAEPAKPGDFPSADIQTPDEVAGARLRPQYERIRASDGSVVLYPRGWYDSERKEPCSFQELADGKLHCAPYGEEPALSPDVFFQDAACGQPVIGFTSYKSSTGAQCAEASSKAPNRYVRIVPRGTRCTAPHLAEFPKSGRLAVTQVYQKLPGGVCKAFPLTQATYEVFALPQPLADIDPSAFVAVTTSDVVEGSSSRLRISRTKYTGADNSTALQSGRILDSERNDFCSRYMADDGELRCLPSAASVYTWDFSDSGCTVPALTLANNGSCSKDARDGFSRYMSSTDYGTCYHTTVYPKPSGGELRSYYSGAPGSCTGYSASSDPDPGYLYFRGPLPEPIPATAFARLRESVEDAAPLLYGKAGSQLVLRRQVVRDDGGFMQASVGRLFDPKTKAFCWPRTLTDGKAHCVSGYDWAAFDPRTQPTFEDPECTSQVIGLEKHREECATEAGVVGATKYLAERPFSANGCETLRLRKRPATPIEPETLYQRNASGACTAVGGSGGVFVYRLADAPEVSPDTFVETTSEIITR